MTLSVAAREAARRGPHSWGWAWWDGREWLVERGRGPLGIPHTDTAGSTMVVGHSRLATCGSAPGNVPPVEEGQPLISGDLLVAHNGTIPDPETIAGRPVTIDSEAILAALTSGSSPADVLTLISGAPQALIAAEGSYENMYVARTPGTRRAAHPLYVATDAGHTYVCSRPFSARCRPLPEGIHRL